MSPFETRLDLESTEAAWWRRNLRRRKAATVRAPSSRGHRLGRNEVGTRVRGQFRALGLWLHWSCAREFNNRRMKVPADSGRCHVTRRSLHVVALERQGSCLVRYHIIALTTLFHDRLMDEWKILRTLIPPLCDL